MANNPWDKQPGESRQAFEAFRTFRDLQPGTRSLVRVSSELSKHVALMQRWATKWDWWDRVGDFDAYQDKLRLESRLIAIRDHEEQEVKAANAIIRKGIEALQQLRPEDLTAPQLLQYILEGTRLKRLALGEPEKIEERREKVESRVEIRIDDTIEKITPALKQLLENGLIDHPEIDGIEELKALESGTEDSQ
jgi:hypothetical protein